MPPAKREPHFTDWFRQWRRPLRAFLAGQGRARAADVDDVAQEVFLRLMRYDPSERVENPRAYLFRMAANIASEQAMRASSRLEHDEAWLSELVDEHSPEKALLDESLQDQVEGALKKLSPRGQLIIKLYIHENLSAREVAGRLGITERVVRRELERSYAQLRSELSVDLLGEGHGR